MTENITPSFETTRADASLPAVALLTGGGDRPYAFGLATSLISKGITLDIIGSDDLDCPEFHGRKGVRFLNLRGSQRTDVNVLRKVLRVLAYYAKLICYAASTEASLFHILWNNKIEWFDRTVLMLYYRALCKKIALTVHNVNRSKRDSKDSFFNQLTLRVQYRLADRIFVHTEKMKVDLVDEFGVRAEQTTVIPFGINNAVPNTSLSGAEARQRLGIREREKVVLFFGNITPYKGLEYLTVAFQKLLVNHQDMRLIIAGWPKNCDAYWRSLRETLEGNIENGKIHLRAEYIPDEDTELYFKAADVLVLPYRYIYQSGVLFLGFSFGLPVLAADVGSLKEEITEGINGFVFKPEDSVDLARTIETYFSSRLYQDLGVQRQEIRALAASRNSWETVAEITANAYSSCRRSSVRDNAKRETSKASFKVPS
jgi:D-inositol-3-phosphate glycosyltransferase